jgi:hypothetical protein
VELGLTLMILKWIWGVVAEAVNHDRPDITRKKAFVAIFKPTATHNATVS